MTLQKLGYNSALEEYRKENNLKGFDVGRVISEHKERYVVRAEQGEFEAELIGNLRFNAEKRSDLPAVGVLKPLKSKERKEAKSLARC